MSTTQNRIHARMDEYDKTFYRFGWPAVHYFALAVIVMISQWLCVTSVASAADSGKLIEKNGEYVFVESMHPATRLLLERAVKQGTITQDEYNRVVQES